MASLHWVGVFDQGTSSSKFFVFEVERASEDAQGAIPRMIGEGGYEHAQIHKKSGWTEHDPMEILQKSILAMVDALEQAKKNTKDPEAFKLHAIGITDQRETTVAWNSKTGKPYHNAVVWHCTRSTEIVNGWKRMARANASEPWVESHEKNDAMENFEDYVRNATGLPLAPYFSASKLKWLCDNVPELSNLDKDHDGEVLFGTIDSFLIWQLTEGNVHATDVTNASRTLMMDIRKCEWSTDLRTAFGIPEHVKFPEIRASADNFGTLNSAVIQAVVQESSEHSENAEVLKCVEGVRITGCLGDQQAALLGQSGVRAGQAKNTYGTGCFLLMNTGEEIIPSTHGLLTTVASQLAPNAPVSYALEGSVAVAGSLLQWLRDNVEMINSAHEVDGIAKRVSSADGVYIVPAFSGLLAPYWDSSARGIIMGLTFRSEKAHIVRAALEAAAYQTADVVRAMEKDSSIRLKDLWVDGGMTNSTVLVQTQADLLNVPVKRPDMVQATALGAAYAAGLHVGVWRNVEELEYTASQSTHKKFVSTIDEQKREKLLGGWKRAVDRSKGWAIEDQ